MNSLKAHMVPLILRAVIIVGVIGVLCLAAARLLLGLAQSNG